MFFVTEKNFEVMANSAKLTDRDRTLLASLFVDGLTVKETSVRYNVHRSYIYKRANKFAEDLEIIFEHRTTNLTLENVPVELAEWLFWKAHEICVAHINSPQRPAPIAPPESSATRPLADRDPPKLPMYKGAFSEDADYTPPKPRVDLGPPAPQPMLTYNSLGQIIKVEHPY